MKLAAIDVGSNSIHMVVVEASTGRDLRVLDREKDMVRLGDGAFRDGRLAASAQARALSTISRFQRIAERQGVDAVLCAATSAVREAENGKAFLALVRRETGLHVDLLGPIEEARLIYVAVRHALDLGERPSLILDVGGGSVEIIVGNATALRHARSLPLGVLRLAAEFGREGVLSGKRRRALRDHVREELAESLRFARSARVRRAIGTAGTVNAIGRVLAAADGTGEDGEAHFTRRISLVEVSELAERLLSMRPSKRRRIPGMDPARADTLGYGAVVVVEVLAGLGVDDLKPCRAAVREGMVVDYLATHPEAPRRRAPHDVRERSVRDAVSRYGDTAEHGEHVARLALQLFDATKGLHRMGGPERELLHLGGLLHDVGEHVEYRRHHRHSSYLIRNAELQGIEPDEVAVLAALARYHRRGLPKEEHEEWSAVPRRLRRTASMLIALLRIADGLDRGHAQEVTALSARVTRDAVVVHLRGARDLSLDVWAAEGKADLFREVFGRPIRFENAARPSARATSAR
jgi:exopolyphosphatase/guanosine-5'-triphosphate,3'-diphosphate pyrophosphatase